MFLDLAAESANSKAPAFHFSPQIQTLEMLLRLEAEVAEMNLTEMRLIEKLHPAWFELYEETPVETCASKDLQILLASAPNSYAKGMVIGAIKVRLEIASITGRQF